MDNSIQIASLDSSKILPTADFFSVKKSRTKNVRSRKKTTTRKKNCPKGKRRNPNTKRCRIKCKKGFRRNTTTHRCKKMRMAASVKKA
jgi:hypothetical protein